jgi:L-threonylcarbamoyladenylate synthase
LIELRKKGFDMETKVIQIRDIEKQKDDIEEAAELIRQGQVVAFPTETVYGLGADGLNETAVTQIYEAKGRPSDNPLILHVNSMAMVRELVTLIPEKAQTVMNRFWPGPLTVILPKSERVPKKTTGGLQSVAIRMPEHKLALVLIEKAGVPIAAPSANTSGRPSPTRAEHVKEDLSGKIPMILDGGKVFVGVESTIVDFTSEVPVILRPGHISKKQLENVLGCEVLMNQGQTDKVPKAPGMKYTHYAPKANMILVLGDDNQKVVDKINEETKKEHQEGRTVGIIATDENMEFYHGDYVFSLGSRQNMDEVMLHLYGTIRQFDHTNVDVIYSEGFVGMEQEEAIMNRLIKSCGHEVIKV